MGCAGTPDLAFPPVISTGVEGELKETLASLVRRHRALQRLSPSRLAQAVDTKKARFLEDPNLERYQQLVSFMALPNVPFTEKVAILEILQQDGQASVSASTRDLYLVPEEFMFDAVEQQKRARELTSAISDRDRKIAQLERAVKSLVATRDRCHTNEASLERQLQYIQSWAMKMRRQLDELGRIEKSIEDRRQSTPLELPKQDDQTQ
jgi:hypothetical protein